MNSGIGVVSFPAVSLSVQYERFLTEDGSLSADLSLCRYYGGSIIFMAEFSPGDPARSKISGWYAAPGIRYHPLGNTHRTDVGLGVAVPLGIAHRRDMYYLDNYSTHIRKTTDDQLFAAVLVQLSANFQASNGAIFGLFLNGGGILVNTKPTVSYVEKATPLYLQLGIKMGWRW